ncbi:hypothetical protein PMIN01_05220 [Paraphaeosphaeria minitans]|uniref:Uncharacterized protein n=1 Tax=Paraphaeosphaeria minitans TaxID=565426 RepID=A0A9P6KT14_9PLEO|nr:hypothetical protein PMIN01_05220 [Paraphaeosphaeria minitans]
MSSANDATAALAALSLTGTTPAIRDLRALLSDAERMQRGFEDVSGLRASTPRRELLHGELEDLLRRRNQIFTRYRRELSGKGKATNAAEGDGDGDGDGDGHGHGSDAAEVEAVTEALRLWGEVEEVLGGVLEACRVEGVFGEEQMGVLKGACEPGFDWGLGG